MHMILKMLYEWLIEMFLFHRNLSNNKIAEIEDGVFEGASSVNELHLTANQLDSVRSGMFRGMEGLRMLWVYLIRIETKGLNGLLNIW